VAESAAYSLEILQSPVLEFQQTFYNNNILPVLLMVISTMAEIFAVAASVIAVVQIADRIVGLCKFYIESVADTPLELRTVLIEISALKAIFENLDFLIKTDSAASQLLNSLLGSDGPIEGCLSTVRELERLFPSDSIPNASHNATGMRRRKMHAAMAVLAWPLKATKARQLLQQIVQFKTSISVALTTELV
jgi:hypothetical protein